MEMLEIKSAVIGIKNALMGSLSAEEESVNLRWVNGSYQTQREKKVKTKKKQNIH